MCVCVYLLKANGPYPILVVRWFVTVPEFLFLFWRVLGVGNSNQFQLEFNNITGLSRLCLVWLGLKKRFIFQMCKSSLIRLKAKNRTK